MISIRTAGGGGCGEVKVLIKKLITSPAYVFLKGFERPRGAAWGGGHSTGTTISLPRTPKFVHKCVEDILLLIFFTSGDLGSINAKTFSTQRPPRTFFFLFERGFVPPISPHPLKPPPPGARPHRCPRGRGILEARPWARLALHPTQGLFLLRCCFWT